MIEDQRLWNLLTPRQREVATELLKGQTNAQIAAALVVAEKTVRNHLVAVYEQFDVHTRVELVLRLRGLFDSED